jgi:chromosome partitioning protein|tara:strand:+ start:1729 stop:2445 length:717 start_codon:yes stop_codon:yes gene_type:complete
VKRFSIVSTKGGTGKTTTVHNLAAALNSLGKSVLMVDTDPQSNLSYAAGRFSDVGIFDVFNGLSWQAAVQNIRDGLDIISADHRLIYLENKKDLHVLQTAFKSVRSYDYLLFDCPPSLGYLTQSALITTGGYLLPLQTEYLAMRNVASLKQLVSELKPVAAVQLAGVVLSMYNTRRKLSGEGANIIRQHFGKKVFKTVIRNTVAITEAAAQETDVITYRPSSPGAADFISLAKEIIKL